MHGNYSSWVSWSECSVTCGIGVMERTRKCDNPEPLNTGTDCSSIGPSSESSNCTKPGCPGNYIRGSYIRFCSKCTAYFEQLNKPPSIF